MGAGFGADVVSMVGDPCGLSEGDAGVELGGGDGRDGPTIRTCRGLGGVIAADSKGLAALIVRVACGDWRWAGAELDVRNELEEGDERGVEKEDDEDEWDIEKRG